MLHYLGYFAAIFIGLALGIMGGGGSILTVPVLVYLLGVSPLLSTAYSLFVVGSTALVGAAGYWRRGLVALPTALVFLGPSLATVFLMRRCCCRPCHSTCLAWAGCSLPKTYWCCCPSRC
ncbi:MAG: sulfite exporter TauE/SafE family protein [Hymenobacter sp.]